VVVAQLGELRQAFSRRLRAAAQVEWLRGVEFALRLRKVDVDGGDERALTAGVPKALDTLGQPVKAAVRRSHPAIVVTGSALHPQARLPAADHDGRTLARRLPGLEVRATHSFAI